MSREEASDQTRFNGFVTGQGLLGAMKEAVGFMESLGSDLEVMYDLTQTELQFDDASQTFWVTLEKTGVDVIDDDRILYDGRAYRLGGDARKRFVKLGLSSRKVVLDVLGPEVEANA